MADFVAYQPASPRCSGKAQPGCEEFAEWAVRDFARGAFNLGIYNCRSVRGSANRSIHGDGRAVDVGFKLVNGRANPAGWQLLNLLLPHVDRLGIQMIIWDRRIWSRRTPTGAPYRGVAPHTDHLHIEFNWSAARTLTRARVRQIVTPAPPPASVRPSPPPPPRQEDIMASKEELRQIVREEIERSQVKHHGATRTWIREELKRTAQALTAEFRARIGR